MYAQFVIAAGLALAMAQAPAEAARRGPAETGRDRAVQACVDLNGYGPAELDTAVEDGLGDWLVWVKDKDGDLWMCNADADGAVYANIYMEGDLLQGGGTELIAAEPASSRRRAEPAQQAENLCFAVGSVIEEMEVVTTIEDGVGDYLVWLKNADDALWICNASTEAKLYAFEPIAYPINDEAGHTETELRQA